MARIFENADAHLPIFRYYVIHSIFNVISAPYIDKETNIYYILFNYLHFILR